MYRKSAVPYEHLLSSAGYVVDRTRSSFEQNTVDTCMLVCLRCWLSDDIRARKRLCYSLFL